MSPEVIVALDVGDFAAARELVDRIGPAGTFYKVGLELYAADGPRVVGWLRDGGKRVFVDLKAYDIPNTVRGVARSVAGTGASLLTVHAVGGRPMLEAAVEGAGVQDGSGCGIMAVTVLTSFDGAGYSSAIGRTNVDIGAEAMRLAGVASEAGLWGVVCSGLEAGPIRTAFGGLRTLVPGVRPAGAASHDQARVVTPAGAAAAGARYVVLGRAVTGAADPAAVLSGVIREVGEGTLPQAT